MNERHKSAPSSKSCLRISRIIIKISEFATFYVMSMTRIDCKISKYSLEQSAAVEPYRARTLLLSKNI